MTLALLCLAVILVREYSFYRERQEFAQERQVLLQRIQAPQVAVASFAADEERESVTGVPAQTDEELWQVING